MIPSIIAISGSDSGGEAGIQADLQTFNDFRTHGLSIVTAVTAQNPEKIISLNKVTPDTIEKQLLATSSYFEPQFIKTGLICGLEQLQAISNFISNQKVVADPILKSTSGKQISDSKTLSFYKEKFLHQIQVLTPNWPELAWLTDLKVNSQEDAIKAARDLSKEYSIDIFLKGGHSHQPNRDILISREQGFIFQGPLIDIKSSHGTGCRISSAICAALALNYSIHEACLLAKNYVAHALNKFTRTNNKWVLTSPGPALELPIIVTYEELKA